MSPFAQLLSVHHRRTRHAPVDGIYACADCGIEAEFAADEEFGPCEACASEPTRWQPSAETIPDA